MDKRKENGGSRKGAGRKPKAEEQKLVENLTPMHSEAIKALESCVKDNQGWAVKLFFEYFYGKPQQSVDITTKGDKVGTPSINFTDGED